MLKAPTQDQSDVTLVKEGPFPETLQRWECEQRTWLSPPYLPSPLATERAVKKRPHSSRALAWSPEAAQAWPPTLCVSRRPPALLLHKQALMHAEQNLRTHTRLPLSNRSHLRGQINDSQAEGYAARRHSERAMRTGWGSLESQGRDQGLCFTTQPLSPISFSLHHTHRFIWPQMSTAPRLKA